MCGGEWEVRSRSHVNCKKELFGIGSCSWGTIDTFDGQALLPRASVQRKSETNSLGAEAGSWAVITVMRNPAVFTWVSGS